MVHTSGLVYGLQPYELRLQHPPLPLKQRHDQSFSPVESNRTSSRIRTSQSGSRSQLACLQVQEPVMSLAAMVAAALLRRYHRFLVPNTCDRPSIAAISNRHLRYAATRPLRTLAYALV
ncbi:hypothetical protein M422DRAFT_253948 [Sphaerobolus stellatus SS14]|uniref:Uncharacterized protein n=1 Tax=Sphaerobolus stellatus (strain SS14) TaxID=990650 RepID=A0A0C9V783_SPHS4|nr:hypothetical protein M422DRAFT_253948 [Sphaerobolus stellatus SS14]